MPCNSDYLAASGQEAESVRVCKLLVYLYHNLGKLPPDWVIEATGDYYGNVARLDEATALLCSLLRSLIPSEEKAYVYNAYNKTARDLANWWERHKEWDERRVKEEEETRKKIITKGRALKKLTVEEMEALGLT